jgi:hypothetical protein
MHYGGSLMSDQQQIKNTADEPGPQEPADPTPKSDASEPQDASRSKSKSFDELLHGFEEIRKIQTNQEVFEKRGSSHISIETLKKPSDDHETPES